MKTLKRSDIAASFAGCCVAVIIVLWFVLRSIIHSELIAPVGLLMPDRSVHIPIGQLSSVEIALLATAFGIQVISVLVTSISIVLAARNFLRNEFFLPQNARYFWIASWSTVAYFLAIFVQGIANNMIAYGQGLQDLIPDSLPNGINDPAFVPAYILMMVLTLFAVALTRATKMQEDQEGLI